VPIQGVLGGAEDAAVGEGEHVDGPVLAGPPRRFFRNPKAKNLTEYPFPGPCGPS
jgi:hypothetical protein